MNYRVPLAEETLREMQGQIQILADAFEYVGDHVVITDANGTILYANKGMEDVTGFARAEIIGKTPGDLWGGVMDASFYKDMWYTLKTEKQPFFGEVQNRRKDGMLYWQQIRIFPVFGDDGEPCFFIGIEPDITIRKVKEERREQYIAEMERLNDYLSSRQAKINELNEEILQLKKRLRPPEG